MDLKHLASGEDRVDDFAVYIRQSEVAALEAIGEAFVVDAEEVQERRVEIVNVHGVLHYVVSQLVRLAVGDVPARMPPPAIQIEKPRM